MGRCTNQEAGIIDIAKALGALVLVLGLLVAIDPGLLQALSTLLVWSAGLALVVVAAVVAFALIRSRGQRDRTTPIPTLSNSLHAYSVHVPEPRITVSPVRPSDSPRPITYRELQSVDWFQFEKIIALLYEARGNRVERRGGANPDGGIDLVLYRDSKRAAVQCKHWKSWKVGVRHFREFFGGMKAEGFDRGIFVTLEGCTGEAQDFAHANGISIVNGDQIEKMIAEVDTRTRAGILSIMEDSTKHCPKCGSGMTLRTARRGTNFGSQFWGCTRYPRCNGKMRLTD